MKISEILDQSDKNEIIEFLKEHGYDEGDDYEIRDDGKVDFLYDCYLDTQSNSLPFKIDTVYSSGGGGNKNLGYFSIEIEGPTSVAEFVPEKCKGLKVKSNTVNNLNGVVKGCDSYMFDLPKLVDLHDIHKKIPTTDWIIFDHRTIEKNILGLILIKDLDTITVDGTDMDKGVEKTVKDIRKENMHFVNESTGEYYYPYEVAFMVVASHLGEGSNGVVKAQRDLQDFDLDDFAGL